MARSILQKDKVCYLCPREYGLERHHIMAGTANRRISEKYGLWVWLCQEHHTGKEGAQYEKDLNRLLKRQAQRVFESIHGRGLWMDVFRKNYLWEDEKDDAEGENPEVPG